MKNSEKLIRAACAAERSGSLPSVTYYGCGDLLQWALYLDEVPPPADIGTPEYFEYMVLALCLAAAIWADAGH